MDFQDYLVPGKTGLLIGIGGVSMSPLAEVLHDAGLDIRGSDMSESDNTLTLRERGIPLTALPSTSAANARMRLPQLVEAYEVIRAGSI